MGILLCLTIVSFQHLYNMRGWGPVGGWLPTWVAVAPMPLGFLAMFAATFWRTGEGRKTRCVLAGMALLAGPILPFLPLGEGETMRVLGIAALGLLAAVGMPLFAVMGGAALLLFFLSDVVLTSVPDATYQIVSKAVLPSIPLFALAGVALARGGAPDRLVGLMRAWTGWIPGGTSIATILGCAFFTAITGASGVTILALGGILFPILLASHHKEPFSLGLLTASGSVGLLFPPSVPVILYAVTGLVPLNRLFLAGLLPGILLLLLLAGFSVSHSKETLGHRPHFDIREAAAATRRAWGDLLLPVLIVVALFGGFMTPVEIAALAALWAIVLETGIHRTLDIRSGLSGVMVETTFLVGALIVVIGLANALFSYLVDAGIPLRAADWVQGVIHSKWVFLLVLNLLLLVVGALMDIFSAIVVVVPLVVAVSRSYGIDPTHLGIIFLANMELGYLTPPIGMNLFLSSLTFDRPIVKVWRASLPFLAILAAWVILVTYLPWLSAGFADWVLRP
jgi:tripartite ATP-independent transporter DctM subunit